MKEKEQRAEKPSTVKQLAAAMAALGKYTGQNNDDEHAAEAKRIGSIEAYRMRLANALLGIVETEAMLSDSTGVPGGQVLAAHRQALISAGVGDEDEPEKLFRFLRWRTLRVEGPLRVIAQNEEVGPLPLAAAHAAGGLQQLLETIAAGQDPFACAASPDDVIAGMMSAREAFINAADNIDIMLELFEQAKEFINSRQASGHDRQADSG